MSKPVSMMLAVVLGLTSIFSVSSLASEGENYSPATNASIPRNVYWGDTHVHSAISVDAAVLGQALRGPDVAYRFARGEEVIASNGQPAKLIRPLDFLMLSDHAEYLRLMQQIDE